MIESAVSYYFLFMQRRFPVDRAQLYCLSVEHGNTQFTHSLKMRSNIKGGDKVVSVQKSRSDPHVCENKKTIDNDGRDVKAGATTTLNVRRFIVIVNLQVSRTVSPSRHTNDSSENLIMAGL